MELQSEKIIRRQIYERDKLINTIAPYGPRLYACLNEMLAIAEKHEVRDGMIDAREVLNQVKWALEEEAKWN